jgi:hypothetical protein
VTPIGYFQQVPNTKINSSATLSFLSISINLTLAFVIIFKKKLLKREIEIKREINEGDVEESEGDDPNPIY